MNPRSIKISPKTLSGYLSAVVSVLLASWLKELAQPDIIPSNVPILYILAIVLTAYFFGLGPAIFACFLSVVAFSYFFIPPVFDFKFNIFEIPLIMVFLFIGVLISILESNLKKKREEADREIIGRKKSESELRIYRDNLESMVKERTSELEREITRREMTEVDLKASAAELRLTLERLKLSEDHLKEAQAVGSIGSWEFDLAANRIDWSDETYRLYGRSKALGPPSPGEESLFYSAEQAKRLTELARLATSECRELDYDLAATLTNGEIKFFHARMRPHTDAAGKVVKLFGIVQDITERKEAENKLNKAYSQEKKARQELADELGRRTDFTRALVHEMKTPLTSMLAASEILRSQELSASNARLVALVHRGQEALNKRVDQLFDLARGEIGILQLVPATFRPRKMIENIIQTYQPQAERKKLTLVVDIAPDLPKITADENRLYQVLDNLLNNAFKFTKEGGTISLIATRTENSIGISIADTGFGIRASDCKRLFQPYTRVSNNPDRLSGLGLGLSLCRTIVELHHGKICVVSAEGYGSTFTISLPIAAGHNNQTK